MLSRSRLAAALLISLGLVLPVQAQDAPASVRATVNGDDITSVDLEARQFDLIGRDTIVKAVQDESKQLTRNPSVQQELKRLMAVVIQDIPDATREEIKARVEEKAVVYTDTLAVRRVKPKLFAEVENAAFDQLIDERLMMQEAKRQGVAPDEADAERQASSVAKRAGPEGEALHKLLLAWDKRALPSVIARVRAELAWKAALQKRLGADAVQDFATVGARELAALKADAKITRTPAEATAQPAP